MTALLSWVRLPLFAVAVLSSLAVALLAFFGLPYSPLSSSNGNPYVLTGAIQGLKFDDVNSNGVKDLGEAGVSGVTVCISGVGCNSTDVNGNYSFTGLAAGSYTVFENVPFGRINTTSIFQTVTVTSGQTTGGVNFGNRVITPPPPDVQIVSQAGTTTNNTPTQSRFTNLVIRKTITVCSPVGAPKVTLTWPDGTVKTGNMANIGGNLWEAVFSPPFPGGTATMRIDIDCPPDTPGYPENPANIGGEDAVQIGNIVFLDPSGTILNGCSGAPLQGATVTLLKETPTGSGSFVVPSNLDHIPATNPQTTGADGAYAWVVVPGTYRVNAVKTGFVTGTSPSVTIPPAVTGLDISLVPVGGCPTLTVDKFFTDTQGNPLAKDATGNDVVRVVINAQGRIASTNPGGILAFVAVKNVGTVPINSISITDTLPLNWAIDPPWDPSRAGIQVLKGTNLATAVRVDWQKVNTTSTPGTAGATPSTGTPGVMTVAVSNISQAAGSALMPGETLWLQLKLRYALIGTTQSASAYPVTATNQAQGTAAGLPTQQAAFNASKSLVLSAK